MVRNRLIQAHVFAEAIECDSLQAGAEVVEHQPADRRAGLSRELHADMAAE